MPPPLLRRKNLAGSPAALPPALAEDRVIAGKYRLIQRIGTGSMGSVWRADHVMLGHSVAIKFMHGSVDAYPEGRVRFEREAKLSARLSEASQHICRVTDFGLLDSAIPFVVMELLKGEELLTLLKRVQRLPLPLTVEIITQLCKALSVAHEAGVVHRDLKPANVFLCKLDDSDGLLVKLLDFGVAKADLEHEDTQGTRTGTIFGTPGYMSPEQITADAAIDPRADLWSVVVLTYRMVVGRTPFGAGSLRELGMRILSTDAPPPSRLQPDLPSAFDAWVQKGLTKRREDRFATAGELVSELEAVLIAAPSAKRITEVRPMPPEVEDATSYDAISRSAIPPVHRSRWRQLAPLLGVAAGFGLIAAGMSTRNERVGDSSISNISGPNTASALAMDPDPASHEQPAAPSASLTPSAASAEVPALAPSSLPQPSPPKSGQSQPVATIPPPQPRVARKPVRPAPLPAVERHAVELWNKKDEL